MKKSQKILTWIGYIIYIAIWTYIGFVGLILFVVSGFDILPLPIRIILAFMCALALTSPFYLRIKHPQRIIVSILAAVFVVIIFCAAIYGFQRYYSIFTPEKWESSADQRYLMMDSLNAQHTLLGMTRDEVEALLGKSEHSGEISKDGKQQYYYEYIISRDFIDLNVLRVVFENDIAVETHTYQT